MKRVFFFILLFASFTPLKATENPIKFIGEKISIVIRNNKIRISGIYRFENKTEFHLDVKMSYPFPVDSLHLFPDSICVWNSAQTLDFVENNSNIEWSLHFDPQSIETTFVEYSQQIFTKTACYILSTTESWSEEICHADFIIQLPSKLKSISISIEPDSVLINGDDCFYYITRKNFLPSKDLIITWQ